MSETPKKPKLSPARNALSVLLFILAGVLLAYAIYLFWEDRNQEPAPSAPASVPGQAQLNTVYSALVAQGLDVEYGRQSARVAEFTPVGQELVVNGQPVYVFIFLDPDQRVEELDALQASDLELTDSFGDPVGAGPLALASGSNVAVVMPGSDEDFVAQVEAAVAAIP